MIPIGMGTRIDIAGGCNAKRPLCTGREDSGIQE
jgi:hypothetical protein